MATSSLSQRNSQNPDDGRRSRDDRAITQKSLIRLCITELASRTDKPTCLRIEAATSVMQRRISDFWVMAHRKLEKDVLVVNLRLARQRARRRRGWCEGRKPFGCYPGEAETLKRMLQLYRKPTRRPRRNFSQIAGILNAENRRTRTGAPWSRTTLRRIILRHVSLPRYRRRLRRSNYRDQ